MQAANGVEVPATREFTLEVLKARPKLTWEPPAGITYGTPLGPAQLNASANVSGMFRYTPADGTLLEAGYGTAAGAGVYSLRPRELRAGIGERAA